MDRYKILFQASPWLILLCFIIGFLYALILYTKKQVPWKRWVNISLASLRFILVTIICLLLLLNPFIRQWSNTEEQPTVVFAIDNSLSVAKVNGKVFTDQLMSQIQKIKTSLEQKGVSTDIEYFTDAQKNKDLTQIKFNYNSSNISSLLKSIKNNYENRNLDKVVLISDGIYNQGQSPEFLNYNFGVHTLGLGDTTPKKDIKLQSVLANKVAYLGNEFPVSAEIENIGFPNRQLTAYLTQGGVVLDKKNISFKEDGDIQEVTFYTTTKNKGMQHYMVSVDVLEGEFTKQNNARDVYIEVIDGKEKILMVAATPHPDIKAFRSAITKNENFSFDVYMPGINTLKPDKYDIVIFHQIPHIRGIGNDLLEKFNQSAKIFVLGSQTNIRAFNKLSKTLQISTRGRQMDKVTPVFNQTFTTFLFEENKVGIFRKFPPMVVPFGNYFVKNASEVVLFQSVGNIETEKPLLVLGKGVKKDAVICGEGIWSWRQEEYALTEQHEVVDDLINKVIQYVSTKEDKRKLRVYPVNNEFFDFEPVTFETEIYNDIYERVYDQKINLVVSNEKGKSSTYSYTITEGNTRFEISGLEKGIYTYTASAIIKGQKLTASGQFTVKNLQLEALNTTADHNLLKQVSSKSGGKFFLSNQTKKLEREILDNLKPAKLHPKETYKDFINLKWIFFVLMGLATLEWFVRKYQGSY